MIDAKVMLKITSIIHKISVNIVLFCNFQHVVETRTTAIPLRRPLLLRPWSLRKKRSRLKLSKPRNRWRVPPLLQPVCLLLIISTIGKLLTIFKLEFSATCALKEQNVSCYIIQVMLVQKISAAIKEFGTLLLSCYYVQLRRIPQWPVRNRHNCDIILCS